MSITCPSCDATYAVPPEKVRGRSVRCQRCGHEWRPDGGMSDGMSATSSAPANAPAPEAPSTYPVPPPIGGDRSEPHSPSMTPEASAITPASTLLGWNAGQNQPPLQTASTPEPDKGMRFGWAASFLVLSALVWALYVFRGPIMTVWPPSIRFYAMLDLI